MYNSLYILYIIHKYIFNCKYFFELYTNYDIYNLFFHVLFLNIVFFFSFFNNKNKSDIVVVYLPSWQITYRLTGLRLEFSIFRLFLFSFVLFLSFSLLCVRRWLGWPVRHFFTFSFALRVVIYPPSVLVRFWFITYCYWLFFRLLSYPCFLYFSGINAISELFGALRQISVQKALKCFDSRWCLPYPSYQKESDLPGSNRRPWDMLG